MKLHKVNIAYCDLVHSVFRETLSNVSLGASNRASIVKGWRPAIVTVIFTCGTRSRQTVESNLRLVDN